MTSPTPQGSDKGSQQALLAALAAMADGDGKALKVLYRLTSSKLFGICLRICRNHQGAEDALNDVYLSVWRRSQTFDPGKASPIAWLCTIARNRSIDWVRSNGRPTTSDDVLLEMPSADPDAEAQLGAAQERERLHHCLDTLKPEQRDAIRTAFFDGVTYAELAVRKNVPAGTMKTWVRRGLLKLKDCLNGE